MVNDLLEASSLVVRAYFEGSDRSKLNLSECMRDLRACVDLEQKRRAHEQTTTISREHA